MRILQVVHGFPPQEWAGVEVISYYLAKGLQEQKHEVTVFCREPDPTRAEGSVREEEYDGLRVVYAVNNFPAHTAFRSYYDNPRFDVIFTDLLRQVNPHGVHFQHLIGHSPSLVCRAKQEGYPAILSLHDYYYLCHRVQLITASGTLCDGPAEGERCVACLSYLQAGDDARQRFAYMGKVLATPRLILSPSVFLKDRYLQQYPLLADRLRVLPHGVRVVGRGEKASTVLPLRFLYLGALLPHKGVHLLLQALRGLSQGTAEVVICGHVPQGAKAYHQHLQQEAKGLPVRFAGPYGPSELSQVLSQGDVVVVPSVWEEAFALVVREAFDAGLPVIASRIGALPEAVQDGVNGLLFPPGSAEALREAMLRCATDPELFARLRQGVPPVKGMAEYVAEIENVYQEAFQAALVTAEKEPRERIQPRESQAAEEGPGTETTQSLVSIVIPAYNHAPYVAETIDSVLRQTYQNWELIIIDDGSTDATPEIIQRYSDPRIRAYRQENRGLSATLNRGIELARGQYFAFLPSDDVYEPDKLAVQVPVLEENPTVGVVFSWQTVIDAEGKPPTEQHVQEWFTVSFETKEEIFPALFERDFLSTPTHLLRMECFARVGRFDESLVTAQDYDLWLRILQYYDMRLLKRPLVKMRWHEHNQTRVVTPQTERERTTVLLKAFRSLAIEEIFPSLAGLAADTYPETFARAYLTLARFVMRSGLSEMVPVACVYLTQALQYQDQLEIPEELRPLIATSPGLRRQISLGKTRSEETLAGQPALPLLTRSAADFAPTRGKNREKINVLVEVPTLDKGGVEQVVFAIVSSLPRETFRFLIVCVDGGGYTAERCRRQGIPVEVLRGDKEAAYRELLERYRADLVVTHYAHFGLPIAYQMGIPVVTFVHGIYAWFHAGLLGEMGGWDQYITRYVAISQDVADYLTHRFHIPPEKVSVIHNGIESATVLESTEEVSRTDWGLRPEDYVFLNVAAISPTKGHFALLEALRRVAPTYPEVKVLCVGQVLDEEYFQRVLAKRQRDQLEDCLIFAGFHPNVSPFYRLADAFVFPSVLEGFGLAKLEAMTYGLPLILTRVGDSDKLIVHSDIGLLIPNTYADPYDLDQDSVTVHLTNESPANAVDLAAAMEEFVTRRAHWRAAGQQGREKVLRHFTQERALKSYEALFLREVLLDQRKRAETAERVENRQLRNQVALLERVLREKEQVLREKEQVLQEKDQHIVESTRQVERQQEQLTTQQRVVDQHLRELQRLSLTIFDRLDLTKRAREFRTRVLRETRNRLPQPMKRMAKSLVLWVAAMRWRGARLAKLLVRPSSRDVSFPGSPTENGSSGHIAAIRQSFSNRAAAATVRQADEILSQTRCRGVILFPALLSWADASLQRPPQLLRALAVQGYLCVYGTPDPVGDGVNGFRQIAERLFLCGDIGVFHTLDVPDLILWLSHADQLVLCDLLPRALVVYDISDLAENFLDSDSARQGNHERLLREADLVTATAVELPKDMGKVRGDVLLTRLADQEKIDDPWRQPASVIAARLRSLQSRCGISFVEKKKKSDIICFPIIDWQFRYQRPQQILSRFAQQGHRVFYVQTTFVAASSLSPPQIEITQNLALHPLAENVWSVTLTVSRPLNLYRDAITRGGVLSLLLRSLAALREKEGIAESLLYVHLPFWRPVVEAYRRRFGGTIVYDCMDNHRGFSTNARPMLEEEDLLVQQADLVTVSATFLLRQFAYLGEKVVLVRNGADFAHFHAAQPSPALAHLPHPIVGYYGAISEWFDTKLIAAAARKHPEWSFVLIGDTFGADVRPFQGMANVHLFGEKPYADIPGYLQCFDVCCIPFHITDLTRATDPVKFYEYLSAGKPIVATPLPELATFTEACYCASDEEGFVKQIATALQENSPTLVQRRIDLAQANDWRRRVTAVEARLSLLQKKVSVIVLTYNNLDCTRLCLDSLYRSSAYENWELIIVDNNSSDGTVEYLRQFAVLHNNVHLILNQTNAGFARGNNQGITAAGGEIIILLNNDVVVTQGWMGEMVTYLVRPEVGLVGPVTNSIGNEAKVDLGYTDLAQMPQAAATYMQAHQGQCFEIKVLAAFCLGMRRALVDEVGLLDERFEIGMFEDDDYSRRVRAKGYRVICARDIFIHHVGGASFFKLPRNEYLRIFNANKIRYEEKWGEVWEPHRYTES